MRIWFYHLPIRRKIGVILVVSCLISLILAAVTAVLSQRYLYHKQLTRELNTLSMVIGKAGRAGIMFEDSESLGNLLGSLNAKPSVIQAQILSAEGNLLSEYKNSRYADLHESIVKELESTVNTVIFKNNIAAVTHEIELENAVIGKITLAASMKDFRKNLFLISFFMLLAMTGALFLVVILSNSLLRVVIDPIHSLLETTKEISDNKRYDLRTKVFHNDETGVLAKSFNDMLRRIQERDEHLEEKVRERTEDLQKAKDRAESANQAKSEFLANMSHEKTVKHSADSLLGILNDILDFSKIEAGQLQLDSQPFSISQVIQTVLSTMNMLAVEKGLTLEYQEDNQIHKAYRGDDLRLMQIFYNLIGNAIKFTLEGSVSVHITELDDNVDKSLTTLYCSIRDTGIGIKSDKQQIIFENFEQADSGYVRKYGGTGLGLSISKQLVEMMNGRMWVESQPEMGSTFHFTVNLERCDPSDVPQSLQNRPHGNKVIGGYRILIVDDNEANREIAQLVLEENNDVFIAENGLEALKIIAEQKVDLLLMDVQMPIMDGLTATRIIRQIEEGRLPSESLSGDLLVNLEKRVSGSHIPIMAMTAHAMAGDMDLCLEAGMDDYITKPFQAEQLYVSLNELLSAKKALSTSGNTNMPMGLQPIDHYKNNEYLPSLAQLRAYLVDIVGLQQDKVSDFLLTAQLNIQHNLKKIENAQQARNYRSVGDYGHALKGVLLQCGLNFLAEKAQLLHEMCKTKPTDPGIDTLINDILTGLEPILKVIAATEKTTVQHESPSGTQHFHKKVLLMDDEDTLQEILGRFFEPLGYQTIIVNNGYEAIEEYREHFERNDPISLVLLDLHIPESLGAQETAKDILDIDQNARIIVLSGDSTHPVMMNYSQYGFLTSLTKPFKRDQINAIVTQFTDN